MSEPSLIETLERARQEIVLAIAFLGRDAGSDRLQATIAGLIPRLTEADKAIQAALTPRDDTADPVRKALATARLMIRGEMIEGAVVNLERMDVSLGDYIDAALATPQPPDAVREAVARIIDPHSFLPESSGDEIIGEIVRQSREDALRKADAILALSAPAVSPVVSIKPMALSGGRTDYFVSIKVGDREVTPHAFNAEFKAAYHVALYDWLLNGAGEEPDIMKFGPDDWPARIVTPAADGWDGLSCSCGGGWKVGHAAGCPEAAPCDGTDDIEHLDGMLEDRERGA